MIPFIRIVQKRQVHRDGNVEQWLPGPGEGGIKSDY